MATLDGLRVYPIKALDGTTVNRSEVLPGGTLAVDREFQLVDDDGDIVNG